MLSLESVFLIFLKIANHIKNNVPAVMRGGGKKSKEIECHTN